MYVSMHCVSICQGIVRIASTGQNLSHTDAQSIKL